VPGRRSGSCADRPFRWHRGDISACSTLGQITYRARKVRVPKIQGTARPGPGSRDPAWLSWPHRPSSRDSKHSPGSREPVPDLLRPQLVPDCRIAEARAVGGRWSSVADVRWRLRKVTGPARRLTLSARAGEDVARYWSRAPGGAFSPVKQRGPH
jgi:hypothetical protein